MKAKEFIILILIIIAGITFYYAQTGKIDIDWCIDDHFFFSFQGFDFEESQKIDPPFPPEIQVINAHGNIEIHGTEEQHITISLQKKIWRKNEEEAQKVSEALHMVINQNDQQLTVSSNREEFRRKKFETSFIIYIPQSMNVEVKNSYGLVKVQNTGSTEIINPHGKIIAKDITGALIIKNRHEDIEIENILSDCQIESSHSNITGSNIQGHVHISHAYGKIHLEDISKGVTLEGSHTQILGDNLAGPLNIESSYEKIVLTDIGPTKIRCRHGNIEITGGKGSLDIMDKYGKVKLDDIEGDISIEGKNLQIYGKNITGETITVTSSYKDVKLINFSGNTTISLSHGNFYLEPYPLTHPIEVKGQYADINFYWPSGQKYPIEARVKGGEIKWELPEELSFEETNNLTIIKAFSEEKEQHPIFLSTTYGTIRIKSARDNVNK